MNRDSRQALRDALDRDDRDAVAALLRDDEAVRAELDAPLGKWGRPALAGARSVETARLLLDRGASLDAVGAWWAPGFGVIDGVDADVGRFLVEQGAPVTPHAAAGLGLVDRLAAMVDADPAVVRAKGGDGCTPLAFARDVGTAALLVDAGAELDARDDDHASTPAQWLIGERPEVARFLVERGATPDIFLAAALGDRALAERLVAADRRCLSLRVGKGDFPGIGHQGLGGTIYQWTLGFNAYAHQYAAKRGHHELFQYLFDESDATTQLLVACVMARREDAERIVAAHPGIVERLPDADLELVARYCWETNIDIDAVRLMLDLGFPIDHPETSHAYAPLHNAAWGGYADLVDLLIERGAPVDLRDPTYGSTPLGFALHCCLEDGRHPEGEYDRVVRSLIDAGCPWDPTIYPTGDARVDGALEPLLRSRIDGAAVVGDADVVETFLRDGVDDDALAAALSGAAKGGHVELCRRLLDAGAPIRPSGEGGLTAIHKAVAGKAPRVLELLLARGGDVTMCNAYGSTPLHTAAVTGADRELVELLVRGGGAAVINETNRFGATALDWAVAKGHEETAAALRANGATRGAEGVA